MIENLHHIIPYRNHLDFRGRLDGQGARYGKILDFRWAWYLSISAHRRQPGIFYCANQLFWEAFVGKFIQQESQSLPFRLSELRIIELLDNLSSELNSYVQVDIEEGIRWQHKDFRTGNITTVDDLEKQHWRQQVKRWASDFHDIWSP